MAVLVMPNIGEGIAEGTVVRWLKHEGDTVVRDEPIVEIETDKAVVEVPCPFDGTLSRILVHDDETVAVGTPIAEFEGVTESAASGTPPEAPVATEAPAAPAGSAPAPATVEVDEASPPALSPPAPSPPAAPMPSPAQRAQATTAGAPPYSPVVLRLAAEHGVDLGDVAGTGLGGRVTRQDLLRHVEARGASKAPALPALALASEPLAPTPAPPTTAPPGLAEAPAEGLRPLSATRRTIARHMSEAHSTIPVAWMAIEADVTGLVALRERERRDFEREHRVRLTYMPFFVTVIASALQKHPELNATYSEAGLQLHERIDLGIAVATDSGLLVPVLRGAEAKPVPELAGELEDLGRRARERKLAIDELRGATFTLDNTGAFGSLISQPIVPVGQVAIITTEAVRKEVRVRLDNALAVRSVMNLAISFDHRALDGAEVGRFMQDVRERLEAYRGDSDLG